MATTATTDLMQRIETGIGQNRFKVIEPTDRVHAAVAILLEKRIGGVSVLFIERSADERDPWSGQIGFPGGRVEAGDKSPKDAAEREVREELGVDLAGSRYLGRVSDVAVRGFNIVISGFVYAVDSLPSFDPDPAEVAATFWLPLVEIGNPLHRSYVACKWRERVRRYPALDLFKENGKPIWGITYRMLRNLLKAIAPCHPAGAGLKGDRS